MHFGRRECTSGVGIDKICVESSLEYIWKARLHLVKEGFKFKGLRIGLVRVYLRRDRLRLVRFRLVLGRF